MSDNHIAAELRREADLFAPSPRVVKALFLAAADEIDRLEQVVGRFRLMLADALQGDAPAP